MNRKSLPCRILAALSAAVMLTFTGCYAKESNALSRDTKILSGTDISTEPGIAETAKDSFAVDTRSETALPVTDVPVNTPITEISVTKPVTEVPVTTPVTEAPVTAPVTEVPVTTPDTETPVTVPPETEPENTLWTQTFSLDVSEYNFFYPYDNLELTLTLAQNQNGRHTLHVNNDSGTIAWRFLDAGLLICQGNNLCVIGCTYSPDDDIGQIYAYNLTVMTVTRLATSADIPYNLDICTASKNFPLSAKLRVLHERTVILARFDIYNYLESYVGASILLSYGKDGYRVCDGELFTEEMRNDFEQNCKHL